MPHIVWDWNGTLFDDSDIVVNATIAAFSRTGLADVTGADYRRLATRPISLFYARLAGRPLDADEYAAVIGAFDREYRAGIEHTTVSADVVGTLASWRASGGSQSLLSMYPHDQLVPLVSRLGLSGFFDRVDGLVGTEQFGKAPHLRRHLAALGLPARQVVLVGDSVDDAAAADDCATGCVIYHPDGRALLLREHVAELGKPIVATLGEALSVILDLVAAGE